MQKNILFLCSWYPSKEFPTLGNFLQKHAELASEIANIDVLYAISTELVQELTITDEVINNVRTVVVYYPKIKSKLPFVTTFLKKKRYFNALKKGYEYLNKTYILTHLNISFPAGIFAKHLYLKENIPYITSEHWSSFVNGDFEKFPFYLKNEIKAIFKYSQKNIPVSDFLGTRLQQLSLIKEYDVVYNVVNNQYFYPTTIQKEHDAPLRFIHVSTLDDEVKNVSGILRALSQLKKEFIFHIITEAPKEKAWEMIENSDLPKEKCIVESQLTASEIGEAMRQADCLIHFSNFETFSVVLAEAWTSGIPVIYSKCGGLTEINNPDLGVQIPIGDEVALLQALENFDRKHYSHTTINAFSRIFSDETIKNQLKDIYNHF